MHVARMRTTILCSSFPMPMWKAMASALKYWLTPSPATPRSHTHMHTHTHIQMHIHIYLLSHIHTLLLIITPISTHAYLCSHITPQVHSFIIFIADAHGSKSLTGLLPPGCAHVALDTETLPLVFKNIFTRALLTDDTRSKL